MKASSLGAGLSLLSPRLLSVGAPLIHIASTASHTGDFRGSTHTTMISAVAAYYSLPPVRYLFALKYFFIHMLSGSTTLFRYIRLRSSSGNGPFM